MTEHKLLKYVSKQFQAPSGDRQLVPVVLTDSKRRYLNNLCRNGVELSITWWNQSGRTTKQGLKWLQDNLDTKIVHLDNISLYVWLGTCNLTEYAPPFIRLRNNIDEIITDTKTDSSSLVRL